MNKLKSAQGDMAWGVFILSALIVIFTGLCSGGIYSWARDAYIFASFLLLFLSLTVSEAPGFNAWPLLIVPGITAASLSWTINQNNTFEYIFLFSASAALAFGAASLNEQRKIILLKLFFFTSVIVSLYGIYQYFFGFARTIEFLKSLGPLGAGALMKALKPENQRAFSTLLSPNVLACYISMAFPAGLALAISEKGIQKVLYAVCLLPLLLALMFTKSFGGGIAFIAGAGMFLAALTFTRGISIGRRAVGIVIAAAVITGAVFVFISISRGSSEFGFAQSFYQRMGYWKAAVEIIMKKPLTGWGAGSFQILYPAHIHPGMDETRYVHDLPLQVLAETGIIGLAALLVFVTAFYSVCEDGVRKGSIISAAVIAGGTAFFIENLTDFSFYVPETAAAFWFLYGIGVNNGGRKRSSAFLFRIILAFGAGICVFFFAKSYIAEQAHENALLILREACVFSAEKAKRCVPPTDAVVSAEQSVRMKPYDDGYRQFLAGLYEGQATQEPKMLDLALKEYQEAIRLNPYYPFHYRELGLLYMKMGKKPEAVLAMKKAVELYPASEGLQRFLKKAEESK